MSSPICDFDVDAAFAEIIANEWPSLQGRQTPEVLCFTPGDTALGAKAAELARRAGKIRTMPWQGWSLDQIMSKAPDGTWTHPSCCLLVPRQQGKSLILTIRVLYGLFKLGENIIFSAQQWETAKSLWKRTWAIIKNVPSLARLVESKTCSQGRGTIDLASGAKVVFTTRSANAGRGLDKVDLVIYDEAYDLTEADMAALSPTKMAADDPQTIYTSSAVNAEQHPNGHVLTAVRARGHKGEAGLFFAEWMAPKAMDRADPKTWHHAGPSHGVIGSDKKLQAELDEMTTPRGQKSFDVEYLGRGDWPEPDGHHVSLFDGWADMMNLNPVLTGPICVGVARGPRQGRWAIGAAQRTDDGRKHVEIGLFSSVSLDEAVSFISELVDAWDPGAVVVDSRSPASPIIPRLVEAGIEPEVASTGQAAAWAGGFLEDALSAKLSHTNQPALTDGVDGVAQRVLSQGDFVWDRSDDGSAAPVEAATLATGGLVAFCSVIEKPRAVASVGARRMDQPKRNSFSSGGIDVLAAGF
ncbi:hypothetical protein [Gordonia sp. (in: high G+C Gram-positive bacteria)]|uniref:hypothetical protein n=1 Tax=Gordonia sp. (in: high G+C Gram-positive bacteria) TaxID=84139 RepID=UPI003C723C10